MNNTPTVLSSQSLTNSQDPKWVAQGLAFWTAQLTNPTARQTAKRVRTEIEMFSYWAKDLGVIE
jgi:hypothetical protein